MTKVHKRIAVLVLLCVAATGMAVKAQTDAQRVVTIGRNVLAMDDYMLSIQYFNRAIEAKPYLSDPYYYRGLAKLMLEDYTGAEADCSEAISRNKFKPEAYRVRGFARMHLRKDSAAVVDFDEGLKYLPYDKYFVFYKAVALTDAARYAEADTAFVQLMTMYPGFDEGLTARARMNLLRGDTVASLSDIDRTLSISKNQLTPYLMRAEISMKRGEWERASADLDKAVELEPRQSDLYVNRAFVRYNADDWFGAMSDYNYALDLDSDNRVAFYNRALLRYKVQDLENARKDFSQILVWEPDNFYARYNRGLINLDLKRYKEALSDFRVIEKRYPRFYPVFQAMAEVYRGLGNQKAYVDNVFKANELIGQYVGSRGRVKLDRPTIDAGKSYSPAAEDDNESLTEEQVMERFNQLITLNETRQSHVAYKDKYTGKVQDLEMRLEPQGFYLLTFTDPTTELNSDTGHFRELDQANRDGWAMARLYMAPQDVARNEKKIQDIFAMVDSYNQKESAGAMRASDYLARAVAYTDLKDYEAALADCDKALSLSPKFISPMLQRAGLVMMMTSSRDVVDAMSNLDEALSLDSEIAYAWYDKGVIYYMNKDYTSALESYNHAIAIAPSFGDAYYNRALALLGAGRREAAVADLSRAGELGVVAAYSLLKQLR